MSIVKMDKVWIIGMKGKEEEVLKKIMSKGFMQIEDTSYLAEEKEFKGVLSKEENGATIGILNKKIAQVENAIENIRKTKKIKKSMFSRKQEFKKISNEEVERDFSRVVDINQAVEEVLKMQNDKKNLKNELNTLLPWQTINIEKKYLNIQNINTILGVLPKNTKLEQLKKEIEKENVSLNLISKDKNLLYVTVIAINTEVEETRKVLKKYKFKEEVLSYTQSISDRINEIKTELESIEKRTENLNSKLDISLIEKFENLYDYYTIERDIKIAQKNIVTTKYTFYIEGWIPRNIKLEQDEDYIIQTKRPDEDEEYPVLLKNNGFVTPFESITNMYSCPNQNEIDPNPIMSIFFVIFFGMMLSDAGYGIILTIACFAIWKIKRFKRGEGNLIKLLAFSGISTIIWGILFGGFFGDLIKITPVINPLTDVMLLMGLSLLFGIIHIYAGLFMKALTLIKEKKVLSAIFDVGLWYIFLTGIFLLIIPVVAGDIGIWATVGKYLAMIGAIGLVLTQGRAEKGILKKGFKGITSLYDITSYFADVLSYSRIMALCLSTGVIAQVVNLLGQIAGPIPAVFIGLIGHTINIANSALGSYVHTSRLQYVEFFGKFYEGGGKPFTPFMCKTKYTEIKEEF